MTLDTADRLQAIMKLLYLELDRDNISMTTNEKGELWFWDKNKDLSSEEIVAFPADEKFAVIGDLDHQKMIKEPPHDCPMKMWLEREIEITESVIAKLEPYMTTYEGIDVKDSDIVKELLKAHIRFCKTEMRVCGFASCNYYKHIKGDNE